MIDDRLEGDSGAASELTELESLCMRNLLASSEERIYFKDREGRFLLASRYCIERMAPGAGDSEVIGKTDFDFFDEASAREFFDGELRIMQTGHADVGIVEMEQWRDGSVSWVSTTKLPLRDEAGQIIGTYGISRDISRQVEAERALAELALHDPLTGLANRALLFDRLEHAIQSAGRRSTHLAVVFVDLDHFKTINDAFGHSTGDQLLCEVATRLHSVVRPNDTIARLGGDEFVVLCEDLKDPLQESVAIAERIQAHLQEPFVIEDREIFIAASAGVAAGATGDTAEALVTRADQAMYRAKQLGRGRVEIYDPVIDREATRRAELSAALHHAMDQGELHIVYQPILDIHAQATVAREALLRWTHPSLGQIAPAEFIPVAEEAGLIVALGRWVLTRACEDCAAWRTSGATNVGVAVNVSGRQLEHPGFEAEVTDALSNSRLPPGALTLEITESLLMAGRTEARSVLERLRSRGVRIAIDDFGTGYSSLAWLARLPLDILKVDRSFVSSLGFIERESAIVKAMIHLAHTLGMHVVAEGVETDSQLAQLTSFGCDEAQGFLLGYPESLDPVQATPPADPSRSNGSGGSRGRVTG
jgi:diguanylate cyclase (GGDEF)-like protein/PAS domain S-box-containing protein